MIEIKEGQEWRRVDDDAEKGRLTIEGVFSTTKRHVSDRYVKARSVATRRLTYIRHDRMTPKAGKYMCVDW